MRTARLGLLSLAAVCAAGCGGVAHFADNPRPPTPVNLTVYISDSRVLLSPSTVGAGPIVFMITNGAADAQSLMIEPASGGPPVASTARINPQATTQIQVNFCGSGCPAPSGSYTLSTGGETTDASTTVPSRIRPASLRVGPERPDSNNTVLMP